MSEEIVMQHDAPITSTDTVRSSRWPRKRRSFFLRLRGGDDEFKSVVDKREIKHSLTTFEAAVLAFKAALHGSFLLLPWAYARIGHVFGFIGLLILYLTVWMNIRILVKMAHTLTKTTGTPQLAYGDVSQQVLLSRSPSKEKAAFGFRVFVDIIVFLSLFITACIYIVETASFLKRAIQDPCITVWLIALLLGILLILLAFISHLKWLVPLCLIGCICIILGAIFAVVVFYSHVLEKSRDDSAIISDAMEWPFYIGSVPFSVTWIYVILPVERDAREPLNIVETYCSPWFIMLVFIFCLHSLVGFLGYDVIGPKSAANVLAQYFVSNDPFTMMSFFLIAIGVFLTINLLILIAAQIVWYHLKERVADDYRLTIHLLLAPVIMCICIGLAIALYKISVVLAMLATLTVGLVSFIFPPVFNFIMKTEASESKIAKCLRYFLNVLLLIIGIIVICCGFPTDYKLWDDNRKIEGVFMEH